MIKKGLTPRFAEVGKIKLGGKGETRKSKEGKDYQLPVKYEHFVVTTTEKGKDGNYIIDNELMKKLGPEPKEIPIRLPFDSIDMNFFTSFQFYTGNKLICHGDGVSAKRTGADGIEKDVPCETGDCQYLKEGKCKVSGILSCQIPLGMEPGAIYRFRTHSWNTVSSILAALEYISENTKGILQGLPLKLKFLKKSTQEHGNVNIATITLDGVEMIKMRELAFLEFENRTKLGIDIKNLETQARTSGFLIDHDDPEDVEAEYYPPRVVISDAGTSADDALKNLKGDSEPEKKEKGSLL